MEIAIALGSPPHSNVDPKPPSTLHKLAWRALSDGGDAVTADGKPRTVSHREKSMALDCGKIATSKGTIQPYMHMQQKKTLMSSRRPKNSQYAEKIPLHEQTYTPMWPH